MSPGRQALIWGAVLVLFGLMLHLLGPILLPFVVGLAVAYFLDPIVEKLGRAGLNRSWATLLVLVAFFLILAVLAAFIFPIVQAQIVDFAGKAPDLFRSLQERVMGVVARISAELSPQDIERLKSAAGSVAGDALKAVGAIAARIWSGGLALLNLLSLIFIAPVVAFYILRDWDRIVAKVDSWLPRDHADTIRGLVREADGMVAGYMRGMATVAIILAAFYATALSIIGLDFGLLIGLMAGAISFVPFIGAAVGFAASVGVAIVQFAEPGPVLVTAAVFAAGQVLEGNFLTPKLVGKRIQLHPVWVIFALLAGGLLFGFVGVLLAVPVAAIIGVLARFFIKGYLASGLYRGSGGAGAGGRKDGGAAP